MWRASYAVFLSILLLATFITPVWAGNVQAIVSADEVWYDYESKQVEASGNVTITYKDLKVESDYALIDQEQDILLATGNVVVNNINDLYQGDRFLYYLKSQLGWLSPVKAEVTDPEINGPVTLTASEAFIKGEEIFSKHAAFSSCDLAEPHFRFTAKKIEYYPGDRLILHQVWYWEHKIRLLYFPIFYISLKKDNFEVKFGSNTTEGWFLDVKYWLYPWEYDWGYINTRFTEYGGNYYEVANYNYTSPTGKFTQIYGFKDKSSNMDTPFDEYKVGFGYEEYLNPKVKTTQNVESWHRFTELGSGYVENKYNLNIFSESPYPSLSFNFSDTGERTYRDMYLGSSWNFNPNSASSISLNGDWRHQGYLDQSIPEFNFNYNVIARKDWGWSNIRLNVRERKVYSGNNSAINLKPYLIYTIPEWDWPFIEKVEVITEYTHMEKFQAPDDSSGDRYSLNIHKRPIELWKQGQLSVSSESWFKYRDFFIEKEPETELYSLSTQINIVDQFTKEFSTKFDLGYADTYGLSNFYFTGYDDNLNPGLYIFNGWYWRNQFLDTSLFTKYWFYTKYAEPLIFRADWTPAPKGRVHFDTAYDWDKGLGATNFQASYNSKANWYLRLFVGYDFQNLSFPWTTRQFDAVISEKLTDKWSFELSVKYDDLISEFSIAQIGITYDWHCRNVKFFYDAMLQEYWVQIYIKALPSASLRISGANTWENLFNEIGSQ